jgi:sugar O-acyltransferase (sialic acid O-acetyltransferase NeuD family)
MKDLLFWGASGQAKVLNEAIAGTDWRLVALVDRRPLSWPGLPVLQGEAGLQAWLAERGGAAGLHGAVAIGGDNGGRLAVMALLAQLGLALPPLVHHRAFVARDSQHGEGCQILAQASVCSHARLGRGVIVNTAAVVEHECLIEDGVHLAPGVRLAGEVRVGARAFVGTGAIVLPRLQVGADAIVGAGAVVTRDVPAGATVVGNPARPLNRS